MKTLLALLTLSWGCSDTLEETGALPQSDYADPIAWISGAARDVEESRHVFAGGAILDGVGALAGYGGLSFLDLASGDVIQEVALEHHGRAVALDAQSDDLWVAGWFPGLSIVDVADLTAPALALQHAPTGAQNVDVAADGERGLLSAADGLYLLSRSGEVLDRRDPGGGVALSGDRALAASGQELSLLDLSSGSMVTLDTASLGASGWDVSFDGERAAVALGGGGVAGFRIEGDALVEVGRLSTPGATYGVSLDGEHLWTASWSQLGLIRFDDAGLSWVAHEPAVGTAMGVAASGGLALSGELHAAQVLEAVEGASAPEIELPERVWFPSGDSQAVTVTNYGGEPLNIAFDEVDGASVEPSALTLSPGESQAALVELLADSDVALPWTSDDPDEPEGEVLLARSDQNVGQLHDDFSLPGFAWPDEALTTYQLSDSLGQVTLLVYFTTW